MVRLDLGKCRVGKGEESLSKEMELFQEVVFLKKMWSLSVPETLFLAPLNCEIHFILAILKWTDLLGCTMLY